MIGSIPDHDAQLLRGAPLDDGPDPVAITWAKPSCIVDFTRLQNGVPLPSEIRRARAIVLHHLNAAASDLDADQIRRLVQVDLDEDLDPDAFSDLMDRWPELGDFDSQADLDAFENDLRDLLETAGFHSPRTVSQ